MMLTYRQYARLPKLPVSQKELRSYLAANPTQRHKCGNTRHCVLANVLRDKFPEAKSVSVGFEDSTVEFEGGRKQLFRNKRWHQRVIARFDDMGLGDGPKSFLSTTLLKQYRSLTRAN